MRALFPLRAIVLIALLTLPGSAGGQARAAGGDTVVPQTALSLCPALVVTHREEVPPGTGLAVSPDGHHLARFVHTPRGAEITLLDRDTSAARRIALEPPALPPGVAWRIHELVFSPAGDRLVVSSTGALWVLATQTADVLHQVGADAEAQRYPGQFAMAGGKLVVVFWPPESYLAAAKPNQPVEARFYDAASGQPLSRIPLALETPDQWSRLALSPDGERLAVLMRATRWPGNARLAVFSSADGKQLWQKKLGAEDVQWSTDAGEILALGAELVWLDARTGKKLREAEAKIRFSEHQRLRISEPSNAGLGHFFRYNPLKRTVSLNDRRDPQVLLWRLDTGKRLCEVQLDERTRVEAWPTARGEVIALEESYDVRPSLRLLRAARIVTYRLAKP